MVWRMMLVKWDYMVCSASSLLVRPSSWCVPCNSPDLRTGREASDLELLPESCVPPEPAYMRSMALSWCCSFRVAQFDTIA
jgi:hypothetical protein